VPGAQNGHQPAAQVSAIVAAEAGGGDPMPTLDSLDSQRPARVDSVVLLSRSGSFPGTGPVLARVSAVAATLERALEGTGANREQPRDGADGADDGLVLLAPAGAVIEPGFLQRAVAALAGEPQIAWVSAFARTGDTPVHAPPGNYRLPLHELDASPSVALVRRSALTAALATEAGEPDLFERLAAGGSYGVVLQEQLFSNLPRRAARQAVGQD
jgi:hypothetical protein